MVFCSHSRPAQWPGTSLSQGASIPALLSPSLQLISGLFWAEGCSFHGLTSWTFLRASQGVPLALCRVCLPSHSTLQISKEQGRGRNSCGAWRGEGRRNWVGSSPRLTGEDFSQHHRKCPKPFLEKFPQVPGLA